MPQISVIVPVYKVEKYIYRCVDSILAQTYTDFELILVDDGSPDSCGAICDDYAKKDNRVVVIHQKNGGLSAARNAGIDWAFANSDSEWFSFVDSDDWVHPEYLERLLHTAISHSCEMVICECLPVFESGKEYVPGAGLKNEVLSKDEAMELLLAKEYWLYVHVCHKMYARYLFEKIRFPVGYIHEDVMIEHHVLFACNRVACMSDKLYYYWQRDNSITGDEINLQHSDAVFAIADRLVFAHINHLKRLKEHTLISYVDIFWDYYPKLGPEHAEYLSRMKTGLRRTLPFLLASSQVSIGRKIRMSIIAASPSMYNWLNSIFG